MGQIMQYTYVIESVEIIVGKGENASQQQLLFFLQYF